MACSVSVGEPCASTGLVDIGGCSGVDTVVGLAGGVGVGARPKREANGFDRRDPAAGWGATPGRGRGGSGGLEGESMGCGRGGKGREGLCDVRA